MAFNSEIDRHELLTVPSDTGREVTQRLVLSAVENRPGAWLWHGEIQQRRVHEIGDIAQSQRGVVDIEIARSARIAGLLNLQQKKIARIGQCRRLLHETERAAKRARGFAGRQQGPQFRIEFHARPAWDPAIVRYGGAARARRRPLVREMHEFGSLAHSGHRMPHA